MSGSFGLAYLLGMFGVVAFGAVVPVLPTGAAVSAAAALALSDNVLLVPIVVAVGAVGAYLGDLATYAILRLTGERLSNRVSWLRDDARQAVLEQFRAAIAAHELRTLLLSRLVPGGRIPVLVAAALGGYRLHRYAVADVAATMLWSSVYAGIGVVGGAVFPEPWEGVVAAVALVLLVSVANSLWARHRARVAVPNASVMQRVPPE